MLIDHRTYRIKPGHMNQHLAIYEEHGLKAQWRHLGEPLVYMYAESGAMNSLVHQWVYKDAADRAARRAEMMKDPEWLSYTRKLAESDIHAADQAVNDPAPIAATCRVQECSALASVIPDPALQRRIRNPEAESESVSGVWARLLMRALRHDAAGAVL
ncbi:MAG: NIPSNAP family protein [Rhizobiales bacterium]|nr:NIPSNAP family protein [Hyphomicrobiales bacterium]